ncbi:MAG: MBOAT family O-acyltransferase [Candidatus Gastranaerophilaceae bacterium]
MLFNSIEFLFIFLPITFIVYFLLNKLKLIKIAVGWLVFASLYFYSYWKIDYLPLILCSMVFNYSIGYTLTHEKMKIDRKLLLIFGITSNILLLGYFKYFDFLINNINYVLHTGFDTLKIALPLGISFFTFTQIAYLVDAYKREVKEYDFLNYALFVTYFPHLIAGPILHHKEMMPQFANLRKKFINHKNISIGLFLLSIGLFKKVIIADNLSPFVQSVFDNPNIVTFAESWIASLSYSFQLYFDFSGYCDMALGIGYLFNIYLPINFNSPYKADSIQDFWRRWHITLSRFLRNYIYIPLGGNRAGEFKTYRNLFLTFLIGGIWHGANWTFIIWGVLHGLVICIHRFWKKFNLKINHILSVFLTFMFINFTWIFFRSESVNRAVEILKGMIGLNGMLPIEIDKMRFAFQGNSVKLSIFLFVTCIIFAFFTKNSNEITEKFKPDKITTFITITLFIVSILSLNKVSEFLYFQF